MSLRVLLTKGHQNPGAQLERVQTEALRFDAKPCKGRPSGLLLPLGLFFKTWSQKFGALFLLETT